MDDKIIKNIYVGIDISSNENLLYSCAEICEKFALFQRKEFHVTIAYFEEIKESNMIKLGTALRSLVEEEMKTIEIVGLGGAYQTSDREFKTIESINSNNILNFPRVLWWVVEPTESIINFRNSLLAIAFTLNLSDKCLKSSFYPHITIGSGGNIDEHEKWASWDIHTIEKNASIRDCFYIRTVILNKMHITNSSIHPESLFIIANNLNKQ